MGNGQSTKDKIVIIIWLVFQALILTLLASLLFSNTRGNSDTNLLNIDTRSLIFIGACIILLARLGVTALVLLPRRMSISEAVIVGLWSAVIYTTLTFATLVNDRPFGLPGIIGIVFFLLGSFVNSFSEFQRKRFKDDPVNKGRLYQDGLFSLSMHINYFGDILWSIGLALIAGTLWGFIIPVLMIIMFIFIHIPRLDSHLAEKYDSQFREYKKKTKVLIPWIY
ncbi:MAG: DUF1295 domain-containing protein [Spirochaetia bacterium]